MDEVYQTLGELRTFQQHQHETLMANPGPNYASASDRELMERFVRSMLTFAREFTQYSSGDGPQAVTAANSGNNGKGVTGADDGNVVTTSTDQDNRGKSMAINVMTDPSYDFISRNNNTNTNNNFSRASNNARLPYGGSGAGGGGSGTAVVGAGNASVAGGGDKDGELVKRRKGKDKRNNNNNNSSDPSGNQSGKNLQQSNNLQLSPSLPALLLPSQLDHHRRLPPPQAALRLAQLQLDPLGSSGGSYQITSGILSGTGATSQSPVTGGAGGGPAPGTLSAFYTGNGTPGGGVNGGVNGDKDHPSKRRKVSRKDLSEVPKYKLEKSLKLIEHIWKEYEYGVNDKPPLRALEEKFGAKWRDETQLRTYLRRKKIYDAILKGKDKGYTEAEVIKELEDARYDGGNKRKSLMWLTGNIPDKFQ
ncbi:Transcription factor [Scheffersomyces spartinae]|uniref:Transcription factor n=1 Tax=Scheffersomyces spartinae TaxID=45513 RepID=A0A9P7VCY4_9ASCO|nr:Transcription factor [Scheffersomyces spartinae]KAG7195564.1 Transcription factor [Scheffersomyces spartinae]